MTEHAGYHIGCDGAVVRKRIPGARGMDRFALPDEDVPICEECGAVEWSEVTEFQPGFGEEGNNDE